MTLVKARQAAGRISKFSFDSIEARVPQERTSAGESPPAEESLEQRNEAEHAAELIANLKRALDDMEQETIAVREKALEEGKALGIAAAVDRQAERMQLLEEQLTCGLEKIAEELGQREDIAVSIARAVLERILGEKSQFAPMVAETAALWRQKLSQTTVLSVTVSLEDFPSEPELAALRLRLGNVAVKTDAAMASGGCRFSLTLGEVDLSIPVQSFGAERLLGGYALESAAA